MNMKTTLTDLVLVALICFGVYAMYSYVWSKPKAGEEEQTARYSNEQYSGLEPDGADPELQDSCENVLDSELRAACLENKNSKQAE